MSMASFVLAVHGCTKQTVPKQGLSANEIETPSSAPKPISVDWSHLPKSGEYFDVDPCADRLHSIEGELITYYALKRELPATLAELERYASPGETTDYRCPVSKESYVYVPTGLALANDVKQGRLILYDAKPVHDSTKGPMRWGILFSEARGREPVTTHVIPIPEEVMPGFVPITPRAPVAPRKVPTDGGNPDNRPN